MDRWLCQEVQTLVGRGARSRTYLRDMSPACKPFHSPTTSWTEWSAPRVPLAGKNACGRRPIGPCSSVSHHCSSVSRPFQGRAPRGPGPSMERQVVAITNPPIESTRLTVRGYVPSDLPGQVEASLPCSRPTVDQLHHPKASVLPLLTPASRILCTVKLWTTRRALRQERAVWSAVDDLGGRGSAVPRDRHLGMTGQPTMCDASYVRRRRRNSKAAIGRAGPAIVGPAELGPEANMRAGRDLLRRDDREHYGYELDEHPRTLARHNRAKQ